MNKILCFICGVAAITACCKETAPFISEKGFARSVDGKDVSLYTLNNDNGMAMQVTNYGARVVSLWVPNKDGKLIDVVLGHDNLDDYLDSVGERFLGSTIGRFGNRISNGKFTLDSTEYTLSTYNNGQCLHGGDKGFDRVVWNVDSITTNTIHFSYLSPDMEEGFPGNLSVKMIYILTSGNELEITYRATADKATPINLTHHSFFNLNGEGNGTINNHILMINAEGYTPVDSVLIPTGEIETVENSPFDFRHPTVIGTRVNKPNTQLGYGKGYDHNFVINRKTKNKLELAASIFSPESGIHMEVHTTEPAIQFYGGNFFDGSESGKSNKPYGFRESFALETQHYPDSPNQPHFPSTILRPEDEYYHKCVYRFDTKTNQ